ncbi:MAG: MepB family protein [Rhizobiales bacterium]|nr:MepB family protein [Hyphomicrobiales bacterium]NRB14511.1 MepB family protein [Hyphomicrobiales bacterium]
MKNNYSCELETLLIREFIPADYKFTKNIELDPVPESSKYAALVFDLNGQNIIFRKGKVTPDRPGAFLAVWRRPAITATNVDKPIPLKSDELDYLFVQVQQHSKAASNEGSINKPKHGMFIFPITLLVEKGIVSSGKNKGKTGFRVFPPWSQDRGDVGTKVFSESGKKAQRWQLPYFLEIDENGKIDPGDLNKLFSH